tara:strand:+ start:1838 stop:2299 length:462 start_codon:yes stop_codon:yes gene_type:complete
MASVALNTTTVHTITKFGFCGLTRSACIEVFKDGRVFSHFIEKWLAMHYLIDHVPGCKSHDFTDRVNTEILYDEKTFTKSKGGCRFCPSSMIGAGRKFDKAKHEEHCSKLIFCFVSNINFPEIKVKFVPGIELMQQYPKGYIPLRDHDLFFKN